MTTNAPEESTNAPTAAAEPQGRYRRQCCECGKQFLTNHHSKNFCSDQHRQAFVSRQTARGKVLLPLALGWRVERGAKGTVGAQAHGEMVQLLDQFAAEDHAAGRPKMTLYVDRLLNHSVTPRWKDGRTSTRSAPRKPDPRESQQDAPDR